MTTKRSSVPSASRLSLETGLAAAGIAAALVALVGSLNDAVDATRIGLCGFQIAAVGLVLVRALRDFGWTSAGFVLGAAWAAIFVVPSVVYTVDPSLFGPADLTGTLATVTAATATLALAYVMLAPAPRAAHGVLSLLPGRISRVAATVGYLLGLAALGVIVMRAGGPVAFLSQLDQTAGTTAGLFYVFAVALLIRWVPAAIIAQRWGTGEAAGRVPLLAYAFGTVLLGLTGARLFLVIGVLEIAMLWSLLRRPIPLGRVLGVGAVVGFLIVFGLGTFKRYQSAQTAGLTKVSFATYATTTAPSEAVQAYVNNYVDSVRLLGLARVVVPGFAPYEGVRPLKELALKPLPSAIRPELTRDPTVNLVFAPAGTGMYSVPLVVNAYLAGGIVVVLLVTLLIGFCAVRIDAILARADRVPTWRLLVVVAALLELPLVVRSGIPNGVAAGLTDVIGSGVAAWLVVRPVLGGPSHGKEPA